jgi:DnaK suppressor protein
MTQPRATPAADRPTHATLAGNPAKSAVETGGMAREYPRVMGRIEADAREALLRRRRTLSQAPVPVAAHAADPTARWTDYEGHPRPPGEGVRMELAEIDAALARIREGRYGVCQSCGGPMGLQRLRAIPEARYCLACSGQVAHE